MVIEKLSNENGDYVVIVKDLDKENANSVITALQSAQEQYPRLFEKGVLDFASDEPPIGTRCIFTDGPYNGLTVEEVYNREGLNFFEKVFDEEGVNIFGSMDILRINMIQEESMEYLLLLFGEMEKYSFEDTSLYGYFKWLHKPVKEGKLFELVTVHCAGLCDEESCYSFPVEITGEGSAFTGNALKVYEQGGLPDLVKLVGEDKLFKDEKLKTYNKKVLFFVLRHKRLISPEVFYECFRSSFPNMNTDEHSHEELVRIMYEDIDKILARIEKSMKN